MATATAERVEPVQFSLKSAPSPDDIYIRNGAGGYVVWDKVPHFVEVTDRLLMDGTIIPWLNGHGFKILQKTDDTTLWGR